MPHWLSYTSYSLYFDGADMTADDTEFLLAIAAYQKRHARRYPTWLEALHIARCLGYRKVADAVPIDQPTPPSEANPGREATGDSPCKAAGNDARPTLPD